MPHKCYISRDTIPAGDTVRPLCSVVVPCYNQGRYLAAALESVRAQSLVDWECLVVDDGSTDDSRPVADRFAAFDRRITAFSIPHGGQCAARNYALDRIRGRFVQFLDADDVISPQKLELQVSQLSGVTELAIAFSDYRYVHEDDPDRPVTRRDLELPRFTMRRPLCDLVWRWERSLSIPCNSFLFDARLFGEHGLRFDANLRNHVDWDCWLSVFKHRPHLFHTGARLAVYNLRQGTVTRDRAAMQRGFRQACLKQFGKFADDPEILGWLGLRLLAIELEPWRRRTHRVYARTIPWPIQQALHRWRKHLSSSS